MIDPKTKQIFMMMALTLLLNTPAKASQPAEEIPTQTEVPLSAPVDATPVLPSTGTSSDPLPVTESAEQLEIEELRRTLEALQIEKSSVEEKLRLIEEESSQQENTLGNLSQENERLRSESDSLREKSLQQESALKKLEEEAKDIRPIATGYSEDIKRLMEKVEGFSITPPELDSLLTGEELLEILYSKAQSFTEKIQAQQEVYRKSNDSLRKIYLLLDCHRGGIKGGIQEQLKLAQSDLAKSGEAFVKALRTMLTHLKKTKATPTDYATPLFSKFLCLAWLLTPDAVINDIELKGVWGKFLTELCGSEQDIKEFLRFIEKLPSLEKTERI